MHRQGRRLGGIGADDAAVGHLLETQARRRVVDDARELGQGGAVRQDSGSVPEA